MEYIVNASNLHVGGGVQVAVSFIDELSRDASSSAVRVWSSSEVDANLRRLGVNFQAFKEYLLVDIYGFQSFPRAMLSRLEKGGVIFTIFGPLYKRVGGLRSIVGFAQPWIIYPRNECYGQMSVLKKFISKIKFLSQRFFFMKNSDVLVVEAEHVKERLTCLGVKCESQVVVINNTISSVYLDPSLWSDFSLPVKRGDLSLGFLGRNYPHKNVALIPEVKRLLQTRYGLSVDFYVTFNEAEWSMASEELKAAVVNVGVLDVVDCPGFYRSLDGLFFPSLLECFSASPLEAMAMGCPVFSSDRPFNRDVSKEYACYFDPLDASAAAKVIADYFRLNEDIRKRRLDSARSYALNFSSASGRARRYLDLLFSG